MTGPDAGHPLDETIDYRAAAETARKYYEQLMWYQPRGDSPRQLSRTGFFIVLKNVTRGLEASVGLGSHKVDEAKQLVRDMSISPIREQMANGITKFGPQEITQILETAASLENNPQFVDIAGEIKAAAEDYRDWKEKQ